MHCDLIWKRTKIKKKEKLGAPTFSPFWQGEDDECGRRRHEQTHTRAGYLCVSACLCVKLSSDASLPPPSLLVLVFSFLHHVSKVLCWFFFSLFLCPFRSDGSALNLFFFLLLRVCFGHLYCLKRRLWFSVEADGVPSSLFCLPFPFTQASTQAYGECERCWFLLSLFFFPVIFPFVRPRSVEEEWCLAALVLNAFRLFSFHASQLRATCVVLGGETGGLEMWWMTASVKLEKTHTKKIQQFVRGASMKYVTWRRRGGRDFKRVTSFFPSFLSPPRLFFSVVGYALNGVPSSLFLSFYTAPQGVRQQYEEGSPYQNSCPLSW